MDLYIIQFKDGRTEEWKFYTQFKDRLYELESQGLKRDRDFKAFQLWL